MKFKKPPPQAFVGGLAAIALFQMAARPDPQTQAVSMTVGDSKDNVQVVMHLTDGKLARETNLGDVMGERCEYVMVYDPDCYWCAYYAPMWVGVDSVTVGAERFAVRWLSNDPAPEKARAFVETQRISAPSLVVASHEDASLFGVNATPTLIIVRQGVVVSMNVGIDPNELPAPPAECLN